MTYHLMALGGVGVISVASNIVPAKILEFTKAMNAGEWDKARKMHLELYNLFKVLFVETNPGPVKYAAELMGIMNKRMRLPMTPPLEQNQAKVKAVLESLKFL